MVLSNLLSFGITISTNDDSLQKYFTNHGLSNKTKNRCIMFARNLLVTISALR